MLSFRPMLLPHQPSRRSFLIHTLSLATTAGLAIAGSGCAAIAGVQDAEFHFQVEPKALMVGSFFWWTELTIDYDTSSLQRATLLSATVDVEEPVGTADLAFLQDVEGTAVVKTMPPTVPPTVIATCDKFPRGEQAVIMKVQYHGDLRQFFTEGPDGHTIRIEWRGHLNPAFTQLSPTGYKVRARVKISIE
jgi:hypothetical protein